MKIIDNPAFGIGLLLCVGLAVLGLSLMTTAEGQYRANVIVTMDDSSDVVFSKSPRRQVSAISTQDEDVSPFLDPQPARTNQPIHSRAVAQPAPHAVRIPGRFSPAPVTSNNDDPFAGPLRWMTPMSVVQSQADGPVRAEKRDELLFRIAKLRLQRGEYEKLMPVVAQMQKPETAIEAMLEFAEESDDDIEKLLDVLTALTLQIGRPQQHFMPGAAGMPGQPMPVPGHASGQIQLIPSPGGTMGMVLHPADPNAPGMITGSWPPATTQLNPFGIVPNPAPSDAKPLKK